ncbi:APC family permease, partial [Streptomyces sp. SID3343]|uniref:APC family permease n=1 Tax=Streptomyces sp. SID3343 TaxID=2690260 RepID=UPI001F1F335D
MVEAAEAEVRALCEWADTGARPDGELLVFSLRLPWRVRWGAGLRESARRAVTQLLEHHAHDGEAERRRRTRLTHAVLDPPYPLPVAVTRPRFSWQVGLAVVVVMLTVVASYRQNVHAYPSGGGDYEVASVNLGPNAGLTVGSALLVDYVLTVAVSVSSGVANMSSAIPALASHKVLIAVALVLVLMGMNLRGVRESGKLFAVPTYA